MASVRHVWPCAEVDEVADSVHTCILTIRHLILNEIGLELVVAEEVKCLLLRQLQSFKRQLRLDYGFDLLLEIAVVRLGHDCCL